MMIECSNHYSYVLYAACISDATTIHHIARLSQLSALKPGSKRSQVPGANTGLNSNTHLQNQELMDTSIIKIFCRTMICDNINTFDH